MTTGPAFREGDHPRGFNGQFVESVKPEARGVEPLKLFDRKEGTFLNPPASKTAEHCVEFWSNVEIPDEIVVAFRDAQYAVREQRVQPYRQAEFDSWLQQWSPANPGATEPQRNTAWAAYSKQIGLEDRLEEKIPSLAYQDAAQAIRALQMVLRCPDERRWPDEAQKVFDHEIETWDGVVTALELCKQHKLKRVSGVLERMPVHSDGLNPAILQALQSLHDELGGMSTGIRQIRRNSSDMLAESRTTSY